MSRQRRHPSDLTDAQWAVVEALLPGPTRHPRGGRREKHPRRAIVDAILYVVRTGCSWRQLPADFPPWQTVYLYFVRREEQNATTAIVDAVRERLRAAEGRDPEPTAGLIDSQSVKGADTVGRDTRGYDAGKKVNGRKRFIVTDTLGLLLVVMACAASVQDRDGGRIILNRLDDRRREVRHVFARRWLRRPTGRVGRDHPADDRRRLGTAGLAPGRAHSRSLGCHWLRFTPLNRLGIGAYR